jgi:hypothetical protein
LRSPGRCRALIERSCPAFRRPRCLFGARAWPSTASPQAARRAGQFLDGSTAYLRSYVVPDTGGYGYDVTLVKPDGSGVSVSSAAYRPAHADMPDAPLSLGRVLEIARQITVTP